MAKPPRAFILNGNGGLNAFATKFAGTHYVVLLSDVVDAMAEHADGVKFYMGHELAHLRLRHLGILHLIRWPVLWLPLVGAAYSRARETSCDRHGLACCESGEGAARSLVALAAGPAQWKRLDLPAWLEQAKQASGFWMSFHELIAGYPWLTKRTLRVMQPEGAMPRRNGFAYALAIFVPYAGRLGAGFATLILIYIVGVMAAVAIPAYNDYKARAVYSVSVDESQPVRDALGSYFLSHKQVPESLAAVGVEPKLPDGTELALDTDNMVLTLSTKGGEIYMVPSLDDAGNVVWRCEGSDKVKPSQLPASCR